MVAPVTVAAEPPRVAIAFDAARFAAQQGVVPAEGAQAAPAAAAPASRPPRHAEGDPLEGINRAMFSIHQKADRVIFRPAALGYRDAVPRPMRKGLRNFFSNLTEPIVFLNDLLQLKPGRAVKTLGRFMINSTLGLGGFLNVADEPKVKLHHHNNGFGNTLAYYGVGPGPYIFIPFGGPTTLRDLLGGQADRVILPATVGTPFDDFSYQLPEAAITGLDARAEADPELKALFAGAADPYATLRSVWMQNRLGEIRALHSHAPSAAKDPLAEPLLDPSATPGKAVPGGTPELSDPLTDPAAGAAPAQSPTPEPAKPAPQSDAPELSDPLADPAAAAPAKP
jgi:phospholipid-binding lipoprotein MlaA